MRVAWERSSESSRDRAGDYLPWREEFPTLRPAHVQNVRRMVELRGGDVKPPRHLTLECEPAMVSAIGQSDFHLTIPSRLDYIFALCGFFENLLGIMSFDDDTKGAVVVGITEAVTNAIQHGNQMDEAKPVEIRAEMHGDEFVVIVRDYGNGLVNREPGDDDDALPEDIFATRGRGIALMRALMDHVEFDWSEAGTTVRLTKLRPAPDATG